MIVNNRLTEPGDIRRVDISPDTVRIVLYDRTERVYTNNAHREIEQADFGALDAAADQRGG